VYHPHEILIMVVEDMVVEEDMVVLYRHPIRFDNVIMASVIYQDIFKHNYHINSNNNNNNNNNNSNHKHHTNKHSSNMVDDGVTEINKVYEMTRGNRSLIVKVFGILLFFVVFVKFY